jgi:hypothetical protein
MTFQLFIAIAAIFWLVSLVVCVIAFFTKRFIISVLLSIAALAIGYYGLTRFHFSASQTVNGKVQWSINSKYFFIATLILAALTIACTFWKHRKSATPGHQAPHPAA